MMNERGRSKDLLLLSEYLDSRLSESEKQNLEARLAQDAVLRERLDNLRKTKIMLSRLSRVKAPRHFTLTPEMVKVRKRKQYWLLSMRWAASVAAILLVVLFGANTILRSPIIAQPKMEAAPVMESMAFSDEAATISEPTPEPLILWGAPNAAGSGGGGEAESGVIGIGGGGGGGTSEEPVTEMVTPPEEATEEPVIITEETVPEDTRTASKDAEESPILGLNPAQGGEIVSSSEPITPPQAETWLSNISTIQWIELALALITLGSGVTWLILRKR